MNNTPILHPTTFVTMQINTHHPAIANWTTKEKYELMKALRPNVLDISLLLQKIPTKTRAEIEAAIKFYVSIAKHHPMLAPPPPPPPKPQKKDKKRKASELNESSTDTLRQLEEELKEVMPTNTLVIETAAAVRMIAESDAVPPMEPTNSIDSQDVYNEIANVMKSKSSTHTPGTTVFNKSLEKTAGRADVLDSEMTEILKSIKVPKRSGAMAAGSAAASASTSASTSMYGPSTSTYAAPSSSFPSTSAMASTSASTPQPANYRQRVIRRDMATQHDDSPMDLSEDHMRTSAGSFDFNNDL